MDWLNWEQRLKELSGDTSEAWPDPNLQQAEERILKYASGFAATWMQDAWAVTRDALNKPSLRTYQRVKDVTEDDPLNVDHVAEEISNVIQLAERRVKHIDRLPEKGPWINVPEAPGTLHVVNIPKYPKQAEWIARQSAASKMREWAGGMREDVRWQVVQAIRESITANELAERLEQRWAHYGQHFQTIAATEMSMAYNDATLTMLAGKHVVVPVIGDGKVCSACKHLLEGKVFYVSPVKIENPTKQQREQYLWPGKSNVGRKREDWIPCLPLHPKCRHVIVKYRGGDPYSYMAPKRELVSV